MNEIARLREKNDENGDLHLQMSIFLLALPLFAKLQMPGFLHKLSRESRQFVFHLFIKKFSINSSNFQENDLENIKYHGAITKFQYFGREVDQSLRTTLLMYCDLQTVSVNFNRPCT